MGHKENVLTKLRNDVDTPDSPTKTEQELIEILEFVLSITPLKPIPREVLDWMAGVLLAEIEKAGLMVIERPFIGQEWRLIGKKQFEESIMAYCMECGNKKFPYPCLEDGYDRLSRCPKWLELREVGVCHKDIPEKNL